MDELPGGEGVESGIGDGVRPVDLACTICGGVVGHLCGEEAAGGVGRGDGDRLNVSEVDVSDGEETGIGERGGVFTGGAIGEFAYAAIEGARRFGGSCDEGIVVGTTDGEREGAGSGAQLAIGDGVGVGEIG